MCDREPRMTALERAAANQGENPHDGIPPVIERAIEQTVQHHKSTVLDVLDLLESIQTDLDQITAQTGLDLPVSEEIGISVDAVKLCRLYGIKEIDVK